MNPSANMTTPLSSFNPRAPLSLSFSRLNVTMEMLPSNRAAGNLILVAGNSIFLTTATLVNLRLVAIVKYARDTLEIFVYMTHTTRFPFCPCPAASC